jgi:hypothetical protein
MDAKTLADAITGSQYPFSLSRSLCEDAKENRLVVVYGASDDLLEFEGAFRDEVGAYGGRKVRVDSLGIVPTFEDVKNEREKVLESYFKRKYGGIMIEAVWAPKDYDVSWEIKTDIPHAKFRIMEGDAVFCVGIVFSLADIPS